MHGHYTVRMCYFGCDDSEIVLQNEAAKIILNKPVYSSSTSALASLGWKDTKSKETIS